ncbi:MAG: type II and III secretion system protein family protein [Myxococcota bacterium]|nr:type II and III secretion system protein family protein [Myxococcota bacterium]
MLKRMLIGGGAATAVLLANSALAAGPEALDVLRTSRETVVELSAPTDAAGRLHRVFLERGKSTLIRTAFDVKRVAVGRPSVADVNVLGPREVQVVARRIGETNLVLWSRSGRVEMAVDLAVGPPHSALQAELQRIFENPTLEVDATGHAIVLKGTVDSPVDMDRAIQVARASIPRETVQAGQGAGGETLTVEEGEDRVVNLMTVGGNQQVMIEVIVAEMSRTLRRRLGTNFAGVTSIGGADVNFFSFLQNLTRLDPNALTTVIDVSQRVNFITTISKGSTNLDIFVEAIQEDGLVKILAEPNLVARTGEDAQFLVGGEVPIPVPQSGAIGVITIEYKEFGVGVTFTPTVLGSDRIHMQVSTEVSEPDLTLGAEIAGFVVPAFNTRRAATAVELGDGESFGIAGLLRDDVTEVIHRFPVLGDIPILGALFRSTQFEKKATELVIIATPRLVKPLPPGRPPLPTDHFVEPDAAEFFLLGSLEGNAWDRFWDAGQAAVGMDPDEPETPEKPVGETGDPLLDGMAGDAGHRLDVELAEAEL